MKSSIGSMAMGHELAVTSIQLATAGAAIANGGTLIKPRLVMARQHPGGNIERFAADKGERILQPETAIQLRQMMEGVVLHGTGTRAVLQGYTSGGKTGSAQIYDAELRTYTHTYNASFLGFAPVTNPRVVIAVTLHRTTGGTQGYGGVRAAPVFREVAMSAMRMLDVPQDLPTARPEEISGADEVDLPIASLADPELAQRSVSSVTPPLALAGSSELAQSQRPFLSGGVPSLTAGAIKDVGSPGRKPGDSGPRVPDFRGKTIRDVVRESTAAGLNVEVVGTGLAMAQYPAPGAAVEPHASVTVQFGR
jgi:cell division protein FtsI (penicillin-binding protein 3)